MGHHLGEVPHIDQRTADGTFTEMIGLGLCYAVTIAPELHSRTSYSKATPSGSFSLKPLVRGDRIGKHLQMNGVARMASGIDVNPNGRQPR
jgi:hypothetical protein